MVRVADPLLPQIAADIGTTVGTASIVISAYAVAHGLTQLFGSPIGDRFPKFVLVALLCGLCGDGDARLRAQPHADRTRIARLACGLTAGMIIPLAMAFIGDTVPYERSPAGARPLPRRTDHRDLSAARSSAAWSAIISAGAMCSSSSPALFALAVALLVFELLRNPLTRIAPAPETKSRGFAADYAAVLGSSVGAPRHPRRVPGSRDHVLGLRLYRRRPACAAGIELQRGRRGARRLSASAD